VKGERVEGGTRMQAGVWKWRTGWGGGVRPDIHVDYDVVMDTRIQPWRRGGGGEERERYLVSDGLLEFDLLHLSMGHYD